MGRRLAPEPRPLERVQEGASTVQLVLPLLCTLWLAGSCLWYLMAGVAICRFRRLLRYALPAPPDLLRQAGQICRKLGIRSIAAAPIRYEREVVGLVEVFSPNTFAFDEGDLAVLERLERDRRGARLRWLLRSGGAS